MASGYTFTKYKMEAFLVACINVVPLSFNVTQYFQLNNSESSPCNKDKSIFVLIFDVYSFGKKEKTL